MARKQVRLVDLEELKQIGTTASEGSGAGVSHTMFTDDGRGVLSVSGDYLKVNSGCLSSTLRPKPS